MGSLLCRRNANQVAIPVVVDLLLRHVLWKLYEEFGYVAIPVVVDLLLRREGFRNGDDHPPEVAIPVVVDLLLRQLKIVNYETEN